MIRFTDDYAARLSAPVVTTSEHPPVRPAHPPRRRTLRPWVSNLLFAAVVIAAVLLVFSLIGGN